MEVESCRGERAATLGELPTAQGDRECAHTQPCSWLPSSSAGSGARPHGCPFRECCVLEGWCPKAVLRSYWLFVGAHPYAVAIPVPLKSYKRSCGSSSHSQTAFRSLTLWSGGKGLVLTGSPSTTSGCGQRQEALSCGEPTVGCRCHLGLRSKHSASDWGHPSFLLSC